MTNSAYPVYQEQDREARRRARELLGFGSNYLPRAPLEELDSRENWWHNCYEQLGAQGYVLRARYAPNWVPSWKNDKKKSWHECEDSKRMTVGILHT